MCWLILVVSVGLWCCSPALGEEIPRKIKPVMVWTGTDSKQTEESFHQCRSQDEWQAIWHKHNDREKGVDAVTCPKIDFDSYMAIVIFEGKSGQNYGINIKEVVEEESCIRLRYKSASYQIGFHIGDGPIDWKKYDTQSFVFAVLPKVNKTVVFEEDEQSLIGDPPVWKQRARLEMPDKK